MFAEDSYLAKEVEAAVRSDGPDRGERVTADVRKLVHVINSKTVMHLFVQDGWLL